jgi:SAM-dependent methyltransferase
MSSAPPPLTMLTMVMSYMASQAIYVAARLGVADHLADGARSSEELARITGTHAPSLLRLLRGLAVVGALEETEPGRFALTPLGSVLRTGVPGSVRNMALLFAGDYVWRGWGNLLHCVQTGETAFPGVGTFDRIAGDPEAARMFNDAMTEGTRWAAPAVLAVYDFSRFRTLVDVGGGNGTLLGAILAATPGLKGILADLAHGVRDAKTHLEDAGVADRCRIVAQDMFESAPSGGDAYILKSVIHDWDDERSIAILRNIRRVLPADGTLLLVEPVLPPTVEASPAHRMMVMSDLNMLVVAGGRERTEAEFRDLFARAGFRLTRVVPALAPSNYSVIEGAPA